MKAKMLLVMAIFVIAFAGTVSAYDDHVNKYAPIRPDYNYAQPGAPGLVTFQFAGVSVMDPVFWVKNDADTSLPPFDFSHNGDMSTIDGQNAGYKKIVIGPGGISDPIVFPAGNFTAYVQKGNGDQPEVIHFKAGAGDTTRVVALGAAIASGEKAFTFKIVSAQYGVTENCERTLVSPAHTEYRVRGHWDIETHRVWHNGHWEWITEYEWDHSSQWTAWSDEQYSRWNEIPHNDKQSREVPAVYETTCTGGFSDVTGYFQVNLKNGMIKPIITGDTNDWSWLLSFQSFYGSFPDPAIGIEKGLIVKYTVDNGSEKTLIIPNVNSAAPEINLSP